MSEKQDHLGHISWPDNYLPGTTDNYVSNEIIVAGLCVADLWPYINTPARWPSYYGNASEVRIDKDGATELALGTRFRFTTFGFPVEGEVNEHEPPVAGKAAHIAWHGWVEGDADHRLDVHHAWLFENLPGGRVRILTQETQNGKPAQVLAATKPNPMLNAHQEWIEGLAAIALKHKSTQQGAHTA